MELSTVDTRGFHIIAPLSPPDFHGMTPFPPPLCSSQSIRCLALKLSWREPFTPSRFFIDPFPILALSLPLPHPQTPITDWSKRIQYCFGSSFLKILRIIPRELVVSSLPCRCFIVFGTHEPSSPSGLIGSCDRIYHRGRNAEALNANPRLAPCSPI